MKKLLLVLVVFCCSGLSVSAKIFRVGFPGTPVAGVDYAPAQAIDVIGAATNGDTVQVYHQYALSSMYFGGINKQLVFIGFGYFLDKNPNLQAVNGNDNNHVQLYFGSGSEGSVVQGLAGSFSISANNISIIRCRALSLTIGLDFNNQPVAVNGTIIKSCFIQGIEDYGQGSNMYISNNIFYSVNLDGSTGFFINNVIISSAVLNSFVVKNNIFAENYCLIEGSNLIENNLFAGNCNYSGSGNLYNVSMADVFPSWSLNGAFYLAYDNNTGTYEDSRLTISPSGPAANAGKKADGSPTDAGIYGGEAGDIYRLSGIPSVPSIYKLTSTSSTATQNPYTITVSVRSNN